MPVLILNKKSLLSCFEKGFNVAITSIHHRTSSCQVNLKLHLIFYFSLRQSLSIDLQPHLEDCGAPGTYLPQLPSFQVPAAN